MPKRINEPIEISSSELLGNWSHLTSAEKVRVFSSLPRGEMDDVFLSLSSEEQLELISHLPQTSSAFGCVCCRPRMQQI